MLFALFIQKLHKCTEPGTNIVDFTKKILGFAFSNHDFLNEGNYSEKSFVSYYYGKTLGNKDDKRIIGDRIGKFVSKYYRYKKLDGYKKHDGHQQLDDLGKWLEEFEFNEVAKAEICREFKSEKPDISLENYKYRISTLLDDILSSIYKIECDKNLKKEESQRQKRLIQFYTIDKKIMVNIISQIQMHLDSIILILKNYDKFYRKNQPLQLNDIIEKYIDDYEDNYKKFSKYNLQIVQYFPIYSSIVVNFRDLVESFLRIQAPIMRIKQKCQVPYHRIKPVVIKRYKEYKTKLNSFEDALKST